MIDEEEGVAYLRAQEGHNNLNLTRTLLPVRVAMDKIGMDSVVVPGKYRGTCNRFWPEYYVPWVLYRIRVVGLEGAVLLLRCGGRRTMMDWPCFCHGGSGGSEVDIVRYCTRVPR